MQHPQRQVGRINTSSFIDFCRWISAFLVLMTHINNRVFIPFAMVPTEKRSIAFYIWTFFCGFGHQAVVVFFFLSGYLVGGPLITKYLEKSDFSYSDYIIKRFFRIYVVLLPCLTITAIFDKFGQLFDNGNVIYGSNIKGQNIAEAACSVVNLQGIFCTIYGSNGSLGTLSNEWWYYITVPLMLGLCAQKVSRKLLFGVLAWASFSIFCYYSTWHLVGFIIWLLGATTYQVRRLLNFPLCLIVVIMLSWFLFSRLFIRGNYYYSTFFLLLTFDLLHALTFAPLLVSVLSKPPQNAFKIEYQFNSAFANFSFTLYALHVPIIMLVCSVSNYYFGAGWRSVPSASSWIVALISAVISVMLSFVISQLTEAHTSKMVSQAKKMMKRIELSSVQS